MMLAFLKPYENGTFWLRRRGSVAGLMGLQGIGSQYPEALREITLI